jgi:ribosome biogenesis GTPase
MTQRDKDAARHLHLRGAARYERRKQNEARKRRSDDDRPRVRDEESLEDWSEREAERFARRRRPRRTGEPRSSPRTDGAPTGATARVVALARGRVRLGVNGDEVEAPLGGVRLDQPVTVGDELEVELRPDGPPRIRACRPRRSVISRPDPGNARRELLVAANVDVGVIVAAAADPPLRPALLDRYLIALRRGGVEPLVCISKLDLCDEEPARAELDRALAPYEELARATGLRILRISAARGDGIADLRAALAGRTAVFVGHSGVGKSSALNALAGEALASEGAVRAFDGRGRHTTTASRLYQLAGDVRVIDTAGVRAFGLWGLTPGELRETFPGFEPWLSRCRFADCSHRHEDGCAVRAAVDSGSFPARRYAVYAGILEELEEG